MEFTDEIILKLISEFEFCGIMLTDCTNLKVKIKDAWNKIAVVFKIDAEVLKKNLINNK